MADFEARIEVPSDPATAFDYLADFVNVAEWDPGVRSVTALGEGAPAVGSGYAVTAGFYGKAIELICEITALEAPHRLELAIDGGRATGHNVITIEANGDGAGNGSSIMYQVKMDLRGPARLLNRGLQLALNGMSENAVRGLRQRLSAS